MISNGLLLVGKDVFDGVIEDLKEKVVFGEVGVCEATGEKEGRGGGGQEEVEEVAEEVEQAGICGFSEGKVGEEV